MMTDKEHINTPAWDEKSVASATDNLLQALNSLVKEYNLTSADVLALLSRLSTAQIHAMQGFFDNEEAKDSVESLYNKMLQRHLCIFEFNDVLEEVQQEKRERMN